MVGRDEEFRRALALLENGTASRGVALVGASGVGKSTLARALAQHLESSGRTVRFVLGTQAGCALPLGACSRSVLADATHEPAVILAATLKTLVRDENLVVIVDDAQFLDPLSATLVHQLAVSGRTRLVVVIGADEAVPDALAERLCVSVRTVEGHLYRMFTKLGVERRDQLVRLVDAARVEA